jgi:sphingomyelin phosphodiesterase acid-like 3
MNKVWMAILLLGFAVPTGPPIAVPPQPGIDCGKLSAPDGNTGAFLMLSDIHLDPFADDVATHYGEDTRHPLLKSALQSAADISQKCNIQYDYGVVTGDYTYHRLSGSAGSPLYYRDSSPHSLGIVEAISGMIRYYVPGMPAFGALGNNDSDTGNYKTPSKMYLGDVKNYLVSINQAPIFATSFMGYYRGAVPGVAGRKAELVILNSNMWSKKSAATCSQKDAEDTGTLELRWLGEALSAIRKEGKTATLIMHIPPGIDVFATLNPPLGESLQDEEEGDSANGSAPVTTPLWKEHCQAQFIDTVAGYKDVVMGIYAAHIHRDDFRVLIDIGHKAICPIHLIPAISPIYGNNPAFQIGWYDKSSGALLDYASFKLDLAKEQTQADSGTDAKGMWRFQYRFTSEYGYSKYDVESVQSLASSLRPYHSDASRKYRDSYASGAMPDRKLMAEHWPYYVCAITALTIDDYDNCVKPR